RLTTMTLPRSAPVPGWGEPISRRAWRHRLTVAFGCRSADDIGRSAGRTGQPDLPCGAYRLWHPYGPPNPTNPALWHLISAGTSTSTRFGPRCGLVGNDLLRCSLVRRVGAADSHRDPDRVHS